MSEVILRTTNLSKTYGRTIALDAVNLEVRAGEIFGYIGPNGAGKTTTIRLLLGILKPTSGAAAIFGLDAWRDAVPIHRRIAFVPGDVNLWPNLTGGEVIDLLVRLRGTSDMARRQQLLEMFDLDPSKKCGSYSKGNRQKVALIAALAADAELYILDEPTSGLDPLMEQAFQQCVRDLKSREKSVFLSSHILSEVEQLCDRIAIVRAGRLVETGSLSELRHLTRLTMQVQTRVPMVGLDALPGVHAIALQDDGQTVMSVDSSALAEVVSFVAGFGVEKLVSTPPTLEDLFIRHYQVDGGSGGSDD